MTTQQMTDLMQAGFFTPYCYTCRDTDGVCTGREVETCPDCKGYIKRLKAEKMHQDKVLRAEWMTVEEHSSACSDSRDNVFELSQERNSHPKETRLSVGQRRGLEPHTLLRRKQSLTEWM